MVIKCGVCGYPLSLREMDDMVGEALCWKCFIWAYDILYLKSITRGRI